MLNNHNTLLQKYQLNIANPDLLNICRGHWFNPYRTTVSNR